MPVVVVAVYVCLADPYCCCRFLEKLVCGVPLMIAYHIQFDSEPTILSGVKSLLGQIEEFCKHKIALVLVFDF
jgi:hypothetical protein